MAYGLQVINDSGYVQIDDAYRNLEVVTTGTTAITKPSIDYSTGVIGGTSITLSGLDETPLVFVRFTHSTAWAFGSVSKTKLQICAASTSGRISSGSIDYMVLRMAGTTASADTHGLRVYTPSGAVAFDSGRKYLRAFFVASPNTTRNTSNSSIAGNQAITVSPYVANPWICFNNTSISPYWSLNSYDDSLDAVIWGVRSNGSGVVEFCPVILSNAPGREYYAAPGGATVNLYDSGVNRIPPFILAR